MGEKPKETKREKMGKGYKKKEELKRSHDRWS